MMHNNKNMKYRILNAGINRQRCIKNGHLYKKKMVKKNNICNSFPLLTRTVKDTSTLQGFIREMFYYACVNKI